MASCQLSLTASSGNPGLPFDDSLTLTAGSGIHIYQHLDATGSGAPLVLHADSDKSGEGTITIGPGARVRTLDKQVTVTTWDIDLQSEAATGKVGEINAGFSGCHQSGLDGVNEGLTRSMRA